MTPIPPSWHLLPPNHPVSALTEELLQAQEQELDRGVIYKLALHHPAIKALLWLYDEKEITWEQLNYRVILALAQEVQKLTKQLHLQVSRSPAPVFIMPHGFRTVPTPIDPPTPDPTD